MADRSAIEWTDSTFNPWTGCSKVSDGCQSCYAESWSKRAGAKVGKWGAGAPRVRTSDANWRLPVKWNAEPFIECATCNWRGEKRAFFQVGPRGGKWTMCPSCAGSDWIPARRRVFCASLADVFDNEAIDAWRVDLFRLIAATPNLDWLVLTKRIGNAERMLRIVMDNLNREGVETPCWPWPNVWLGATIVNQEEADRDIPKLLDTPATVRFLSMEPLLGPVRLRDEWLLGAFDHCAEEDTDPELDGCQGCPGYGVECHAARGPRLDWVIVGGESGPGARPMHPDWTRSLRDQCAAAGAPFLFKQWGEWTPGENVERHRGMVEVARFWADQWDRWELNLSTDHGHIDDQPDLYRVGKKAAGRLLDGRTHDEFPAVERCRGQWRP